MKAKAIEIGLEEVTDVYVYDYLVRIDDIDNNQEEVKLVQEFRKIVEQEKTIVRMNEANYTIDGVVKGFEVWYF